ncbi:hypothetical protein [Sphingomonas sp. SRS2]|uniref:hypothetical protein n=1 Tax=Sphingomonas sp. SRS2 TaxID=133190 RepID=UPI0006183ED3|nr:hypothetical protein [Sphingomonas sp. SRS2]KKC24809.1 hypothetical protein WP12_17635 [Sphingomonas sp. SRS2]
MSDHSTTDTNGVSPDHEAHDPAQTALPSRAAVAFAEGSEAIAQVRAGDCNAVRDAGPDEMRDQDGEAWDIVDQGSDESFPASDPPCYSLPKRP